jgi:aspartate 1-decarboxylase
MRKQQSMQVQLLKSKIHKAATTFCDLNYEGSLAIDLDLMDACGMLPYEKILIVNANNGERIETYAIPAERGSKTIGLNGAAARRGMVGDRLTIMSFGIVEASEAPAHTGQVIVLDKTNQIVNRKDVVMN